MWSLCAQSNWLNNQMITIAESITYLDYPSNDDSNNIDNTKTKDFKSEE